MATASPWWSKPQLGMTGTFETSQGLLPRMTQTQPDAPLSFFDRLRTGFEDNPNALGALGMGLLAHRQNAVANPLGDVAQNFMYGGQIDSKEKAAKLEEIAKQTEANRTVQLLVSKGFGSKEYIEGLPIAARQAMVDKLFQGPEKGEIREFGGKLLRISPDGTLTELASDPNAGSEMFGNSSQALAVEQMYRSGEIDLPTARKWLAGETVTGSDGSIQFITPDIMKGGGERPGSVPVTEPKMNESQTNAATFSDRMKQSEAVLIGSQEKPGVEAAGLSMKDRVASGLPGGNYMVSDEYQRFDQAKRDFINASLRRESGAAIQPSEFANANQQYFPQPGDSQATLEQKRRNRQAVIEGMERAAGSAYKPSKVRAYNPLTGRIE